MGGEIAGIEIRAAEEGIIAHPHLLGIGRIFQPRMRAIQRVKELGIVGIQDQDSHVSDRPENGIVESKLSWS